MENRKNDWIATLINTKNKPDISFGVLYANGITPDNIALQDREYYKDIPQVKREFTENGKFNETKFDEFYDNALAAYNQYANEDYEKTLLDSVPISPYSLEVIKRPDAEIQNVSPVIMDLHDRNRRTFGSENIWQAGKAKFSDAEVAQTKHMRDENGNELDWSPNDKAGLFSSLTIPAAALAIYEADGYYDNPITGEKEYHLKGELKLDKDGDPYYQMLGDKESYGRQMLHYGDVVSVEGSIWNKIDLFDADGLESDPAKVVLRSALKIAPFLIPGINEAVGITSALAGIAFALPTIGKAIDSFITGSDNDALGKSLTTLENWMARFDKSLPQNIQGKFFSFENIADIMSSSVNQFASQRAVGVKAAQWLKMKPKDATQVALGYMALTSSTDAYSEAKQAGANDWTAGLVALGSMAAMWGLMNVGYFKDKITEGTILDEDPHIYKNISEIAFKEGQKAMGDNFGKAAFKPGGWWANALANEKGLAKFLASARLKGREFGLSLKRGPAIGKATGYFSRAMNEGVEEVMEETSTDFIKALTLGMQKIGLNVSEDPNNPIDYGFSPESIMSRYGASFLGGALGGVVFEGVSNIGYLQDPHLRRLAKSDAMTRIFADLVNDPDGEVYEKYLKAASKLNIGNKNLSAIKSMKVDSADESPKTLYAVGNTTDNQREYVRSVMKTIIQTAHDIAESEGLNMFTKENVARLILSSSAVKEKLASEGKELMDLLEDTTDAGAVDRMDALITAFKEYGIMNRAAIDVSNLGTEILRTDIELKALREKAITDHTSLSSSEIDNLLEKDAKYQNMKKKRKELLQEYKDALVGKKSNDYFGFALFMIEGSPLKYFLDLFNTSNNYKDFTSIENYARVMKNTEYSSMSDADKEALKGEYMEFVKNDAELTWRVWQFYKKAAIQMGVDLNKISEDFKTSKKDIYTKGLKAQSLLELIYKEQTIQQMLTKLKKEDPNNTEEAEKLEQILTSIREAMNQFNAGIGEVNNALMLGLEIDTEKLQNETNTPATLNGAPLDSEESRNNAFNSIKRVYKYFADNNIVPVDKFALIYAVMGGLGSSINTTRTLQTLTEEGEVASIPSLVDSLFNRIIKIPKESAVKFLKEKIGLNDDQIFDLEAASGDDVPTMLSLAYEENIEEFNKFVSSPEELPTVIYKEEAPEWAKEGLTEKIESIQNLLTTDFLKGVEALNKFVEEIKTSGNIQNWLEFFDFDELYLPKPLSNTAEGIATWLVFNNMPEVYNFIQEVTPLLNNLKNSPLEDFLQRLSITFNGTVSNIIPFVKSQEDLIKNVQEGDSFELTDSAKKSLEESLALVNFAYAMVTGAADGFNEVFNSRSTEKLPILNSNASEILKQELDILKQKITYILSVGGTNLNKRFEDEKEFFLTDTRARIKYFVEPPESKDKKIVRDLTELIKKYKEDFDFAKLGGEGPWNFDITSDNEKEFDVKRMAFQQGLSEILKTIPKENRQAFISEVMDIFISADPTIGNGNMGVLAKDKTPTTLGMLCWFLTNLTVEYNFIASKLKSIFAQEGLLMPTYGQELVIMNAYAFLDDPWLNNTLIDKLSESLKKNNPSDKYINNMQKLYNLHFINGVPGAGKTEIISFTLKTLFELVYGKDDVEFLAASVTEKQADKLKKALEKSGKQLGDNQTLIWKLDDGRRGTLGEYILNEGFEASIIDANMHQKVSNWGTPDSKKDINSLMRGTPTKKFLFFDELPLLDEASLIELTKTAKEADIQIIGLGDMNQITPRLNDEEVGISNTIFNGSYRLEASFRETNKGQANNNRTLYNIINSIQEKIYADRSYTLSQADNDTEEAVQGVTFIYYDDAVNKNYYGFNYFDEGSLDNLILKLKDYSKGKAHSIAIIVNSEEDKSKYGKYSGEISIDLVTREQVLDIINKTEAQGSEYEYIIADISLSDSSYLATKELYTTMSRAKNGAFFRKGSLAKMRFTKEPSENADAASILRKDGDPNQKEAYDSYKKWRLDLWKDIEVSEEKEEAKPKSTSAKSAEKPTEPPTYTVVDGNQIVRMAEEAIRKYLKNPINSRDTGALKKRLDILNSETPEKQKEMSSLEKVEDVHIAANSKYIDVDYFISKIDTVLKDAFIKKYCLLGVSPEVSHGSKVHAIESVSSLIWGNTRESEDLKNDIQKVLSGLYSGKSVSINDPQFFISNMQENPDVQVISLVYTINKIGSDPQIELLPIGLIKGQEVGLYQGFPRVTTVAEEAIISSYGDAWLPLEETVGGKMRISESDAVFLGVKDTSKMINPKTVQFNEENRGKIFAMFVPWNDTGSIKELTKGHKTDSGEISYFLTQKDSEGKSYDSRARIASIPSAIDVSQYIELSIKINDLLYHVSDDSIRKQLINEIAGILKTNNFSFDLDTLFANIKAVQQQNANKGEEVITEGPVYHLTEGRAARELMHEIFNLYSDIKVAKDGLHALSVYGTLVGSRWVDGERYREIRFLSKDRNNPTEFSIRTQIDPNDYTHILVYTKVNDTSWKQQGGIFILGDLTFGEALFKLLEQSFDTTALDTAGIKNVEDIFNNYYIETYTSGIQQYSTETGEVITKEVKYLGSPESYIKALVAPKNGEKGENSKYGALKNAITNNPTFVGGKIYVNRIPSKTNDTQEFWGYLDHVKGAYTDIMCVISSVVEIKEGRLFTGDRITNDTSKKLLEEGETFGAFSAEKTSNGTKYSFKNLSLSGSTLISIGLGSYFKDVTGTELEAGRYYKIESFVNSNGHIGDIKIEGIILPGINFDQNVSEYFKGILQNKAANLGKDLYIGGTMYRKGRKSSEYINDITNESYILYEIGGDYYLVSDTKNQVISIENVPETIEHRSASALYKSDEGIWIPLTLHSKGEVTSEGKKFNLSTITSLDDSNFIGLDVIATIKNAWQKVEKEVAPFISRLGDTFPKKENYKNISNWIDAINTWLKNPSNMFSAIRSIKGDIPEKIELRLDTNTFDITICSTPIERIAYEGVAWYSTQVSKKPEELNYYNLRYDSESQTVIFGIQGEQDEIELKYDLNGFFMLKSLLEELKTLLNKAPLSRGYTSDELFNLALEYIKTKNQNIFNDILEKLPDTLIDDFNDLIDKFDIYNKC